MYSITILPIIFLNNLYSKKIFFFNFLFFSRFYFLAKFKSIFIFPSIIIFNFLNDYLYFIFFFLKKHTLFRFSQLSDIICVDNLTKNNRFNLIYYLLNFNLSLRLGISFLLNELQIQWSLIFLYKSANWYEREVWDMFGIFFRKNQDMRRILTDYGFKGHPLRKDFPLSGFFELFYDDSKKKFIYEKIALSQEYRYFFFSNPWKQLLTFKWKV